MFRFTNSQLPTERIAKQFPSPAFRLWNSDIHSMGAIARITRSSVISDAQASHVPQPEWIAGYAVVNIGYEIVNAVIPGLTKIEDAKNTIAESFWIERTELHIISNKTISEVFVVINQTIATTDLTTVAIAPGLTVEKISTNGLSFVPGIEYGQFTQTGSTLNINTSPQYQIIGGQAVSLVGSIIVTPQYLLKAVNFTVEFETIEAVDWLGTNFRVARDKTTPVKGEFIYSDGNLTLFTDKVNLPKPKDLNSFGKTVLISDLRHE